MLWNDSEVIERKMSKQTALQAVQGRLIVSCQAPDADPFRDPGSIARFAVAAERGGAAGIRANGAADVAAVRAATGLPVFGIEKRIQSDGKLLITPSFEDAHALVEAGAAVLAVECTARAQRFGALTLIERIRAELQVPVMADIATLEEALAAEGAGADFVASTMRGYTDETRSSRMFEPDFIRELCSRLRIPVLAEGRIEDPAQATEALQAGAFAVIVGTAITRPEAITARFARALQRHVEVTTDADGDAPAVGIDLGGTNTKIGILDGKGALREKWTAPTPAISRAVLLQHLVEMAKSGLEKSERSGIRADSIGIATAGWVDRETGTVTYATENLPGWTGTEIVKELEYALHLPVAVENDANALAVAEHCFGAARGVNDFVCITLGTGVGAGCYSGGRLLHGAHSLGNAVGHIVIDPTGERCNCGQRGCLETFANAAALIRYAGVNFTSAESVIAAAGGGDPTARNGLRKYAHYLGMGIAAIVHLLDPALIVLAGGISEDNKILVENINECLPSLVFAAKQRRIRIVASSLGYYGAACGAAVLAQRRARKAGR